jgi:hypothetical protein
MANTVRGLSKARRAGVPLGVPKRGRVPESTRKQAVREEAAGPKRTAPSKKRSRAAKRALEKEPHRSVSKQALSTQAKRAAAQRRKKGPVSRKRAGRTRRA